MVYDIIIIGAGPAGLTSAIYAARMKLNALVLEASTVGGQIAKTHLVENYPGIPPMSGAEFAEVIRKQVEDLGIEIRFEEATSVKKVGELFTVKTEKGSYQSSAVIIATGMQARKVGFEGEDEFLGRGVSYCTICDGPLFKGKAVAVIGGGDSAVKAALFLSDIAKEVFLIHRRDQLRAEPYLQDKLFANPKIKVLWNKVPKSVKGTKIVEKIELTDTKTGETMEMSIDGVFIEAGGIPATALLANLGVEMDERGFIKVDKEQKTNVPGLFAAGDVTDCPLKQVSTAVGQGALATASVRRYLGK